MQEIWKPVLNYEGLYEVSDLGRVKSVRRDKLMKISTINRGYNDVALSKNGEVKRFLVHRLVAEAFCEKAEDKVVVDHINNNKNDNRAVNLRWISQKENVRSGRLARPVVRDDGRYYASIRAVAEDGFSASTVCGCCKGKYKKHHGYGWSYVV